MLQLHVPRHPLAGSRLRLCDASLRLGDSVPPSASSRRRFGGASHRLDGGLVLTMCRSPAGRSLPLAAGASLPLAAGSRKLRASGHPASSGPRHEVITRLCPATVRHRVARLPRLLRALSSAALLPRHGGCSLPHCARSPAQLQPLRLSSGRLHHFVSGAQRLTLRPRRIPSRGRQTNSLRPRRLVPSQSGRHVSHRHRHLHRLLLLLVHVLHLLFRHPSHLKREAAAN
jgi:hypothetical protein